MKQQTLSHAEMILLCAVNQATDQRGRRTAGNALSYIANPDWYFSHGQHTEHGSAEPYELRQWEREVAKLKTILPAGALLLSSDAGLAILWPEDESGESRFTGDLETCAPADLAKLLIDGRAAELESLTVESAADRKALLAEWEGYDSRIYSEANLSAMVAAVDLTAEPSTMLGNLVHALAQEAAQ